MGTELGWHEENVHCQTSVLDDTAFWHKLSATSVQYRRRRKNSRTGPAELVRRFSLTQAPQEQPLPTHPLDTDKTQNRQLPDSSQQGQAKV